MVTGFTVTPGYQYGASKDEVGEWLTLVNINLEEVWEIALKMDIPDFKELKEEFFERYTERIDATIRQRDGQVYQLASGGGAWRERKEIMRKAVIVWLIIEAAKQGFSLNVTIS